MIFAARSGIKQYRKSISTPKIDIKDAVDIVEIQIPLQDIEITRALARKMPGLDHEYQLTFILSCAIISVTMPATIPENPP